GNRCCRRRCDVKWAPEHPNAHTAGLFPRRRGIRRGAGVTDSIQIVVMAFGAVVAVVGLVLMFVGKTEGRNAVRAFGAEFELSTPALVVFLIGAGIFVPPSVVPHRETPPVATADLNNTGPSTTPPQPALNAAPPSASEVEPNDAIVTATEI